MHKGPHTHDESTDARDLATETTPDVDTRVAAVPEGIVGGDLGNRNAAERIQAADLVQGVSLWQDGWKRLKRNKLALFGGAVVILVAVASIFGPILMEMAWGKTYAYDFIPEGKAQATPPSWDHWMGTDTLGRDQLARVLYGGRISLMVGIVSTFVSFIIGVSYGAVSGYFGGKLDEIMMRVVDVLYALPHFILVVILIALFTDPRVANGMIEFLGLDPAGTIATWLRGPGLRVVLLFAALGAISWLTMARVVRGQILSLKNQEFVEAARSIGVSNTGIIFKHLVPNVLGPIIVYTTLTVPSVILQEAFLSFLGLGISPPMASWGTLTTDGVNAMAVYPWVLLFPGLMIATTLFCLNFLGDGIRDALDPQMKRE